MLLHERERPVTSFGIGRPTFLTVDANANNDVNDPGTVLGTVGATWRDTLEGITVTVTALDASGATVVTRRAAPFVVRAPVPVRQLLVGMATLDTLVLQAAPGPVTVRAGNLPAWVTFDASTNTLLARPTRAETATVPITAIAGSDTARTTVTIRALDTPPLFPGPAVRTVLVGVGVADTTPLLTLVPRGVGGWAGNGDYSQSGSLPAGLRLNFLPQAFAEGQGSRITLIGAPTTPGVATVRFGVGTTTPTQASRTVTIRVLTALLTVRDTTRPPYRLGALVRDSVVATGGRVLPGWVPQFALRDGALPRGLTLAPTGAITGVPSDTGAWRATVRVTLPEDTAVVTLTGRVQRAVTILSRRWRDTLTVRDVVTDTLRVESLDGPVTWRLLAGALPAGLSLAASGGLTGTVTTAGQPTATLEARASGGAADTVVLAPVVARRPFRLVLALPDSGAVDGDTLALAVEATGGDVGPVTLTFAAPATVDSLRLVGSAPHTVGGAMLRGVARGAGDRTLGVTGIIGTDTVRVTATLAVAPLLRGAPTLPAVVFGDSVTLPLALDVTPRRPVTVNRRLIAPVPTWATLDSAGTLTLRATRLGVDTLRVGVTLARPGLVRDTVLALPRTVERLVVDPRALRQTIAGVPGASLPPRVSAYLDALGNQNGRVDLGDVRAWVLADGLLPRTAAPPPMAAVLRALDAAAAAARATTP